MHSSLRLCRALLALAAAGCAEKTLTIGFVSVAAGRGSASGAIDAASPTSDPRTSELAVQLQAADRAPVDAITLQCRGTCVELWAAASGGEGDYTYAWDDGSEGPSLTSCSAEDRTVTVTVRSGDRTASATATLRLLDCTEPERREGIVACHLPGKIVLPQELTAAVTGSSTDLPGFQYAPIVYYAEGASLPAGRYRVEYSGGCFTCCVTLLDEFWLVGADPNTRITLLPGGSGQWLASNAPVAFCPAVGTPYAPVELDFAGGKLGIWFSDTVAADNVGGDGAGGRNPSWRLTRVDCP